MRFGIPALLHITPEAADITSAYPDKIGRRTLVKSLALNRVKGLHQGLHQTLFNPGGNRLFFHGGKDSNYSSEPAKIPEKRVF